LNWKSLAANSWVVGIGGSLIAAGIGWFLTRLFGTREAKDNLVTIQQNASPVMTQTFSPTINIHSPAPAPTPTEDRQSGWEIRYPGGVADISMLRGADQTLHRFAVGTDFTFINNSPHQVSLHVIFLIVYGSAHLARDPFNLPLPEWAQLLTAFGITNKQQLSFPLNLPARSSVDGHIMFSIPPDGAGKGIGGDAPDKRRYLFEFEDLLTKEKRVLPVTALHALDKNHHQRCSKTDLARTGPSEEPFRVG
jgi:hypothetical protein